MAKDAEITVGVDASAVERAMAVGKVAVREFANAFTSSIGSAATEVTTSLANVALAAGKVNFSSQHAQVREFEASTAHLAVAMGRDLDSVRGSIESTGLAIGKRPQEVAQWTESVGRLTYNFEGASKSIKGMAGLAAETGRSVNEYQGLAVTLATVGKVTGDTTKMIGIMHAQAEKFGTVGGVAAFADQITGLRDSMSHFAIKDMAKFSGVVAALGKDLSPEASQRVQQKAFGAIAGDPMAWSRFLGREITDKHGQVEKPEEVLQEIVAKFKKTYGKDSRRALQYQFDPETGAALDNADFAAGAAAGKLPPSTTPQDKLKAFQGTDEGKREAAEAQLAVSSRELLGSATKLGTAADAMQRWASTNPITATLVSTALGTGMGSFMQNFGSRLAKMMGGSGEGGAVGGAIDLAGKGAGGLGAGMSTGAKAIPVLGALVGGFAAGWEMAGGQEEIDRQAQEAIHTRTPEEEKAAHDLVLQKEARDRVRAAKGMPALPGAMNGWQLPEEDTKLALQSGQSPQGQAALVAKLRQENINEQDAQTIARAVAEAMKNVKIEVSTAPDAPTNVTAKTSQTTAAGHQGHAG
jgi:hypothetical protein